MGFLAWFVGTSLDGEGAHTTLTHNAASSELATLLRSIDQKLGRIESALPVSSQRTLHQEGPAREKTGDDELDDLVRAVRELTAALSKPSAVGKAESLERKDADWSAWQFLWDRHQGNRLLLQREVLLLSRAEILARFGLPTSIAFEKNIWNYWREDAKAGEVQGVNLRFQDGGVSFVDIGTKQ